MTGGIWKLQLTSSELCLEYFMNIDFFLLTEKPAILWIDVPLSIFYQQGVL